MTVTRTGGYAGVGPTFMPALRMKLNGHNHATPTQAILVVDLGVGILLELLCCMNRIQLVGGILLMER